jgi:hypothetical protein
LKKYFILGGLIVLAGVVINYSLGGFEPVKPELISNRQTVIYGWPYEGSYSSDSLTNQIAALRKIIKENDHIGTLTIINYQQPKLEQRGMVKQFVGIEWENSKVNPPSGMDSLIIEAYNGFHFRIPIKPLVMPSPEKLKHLAAEAAQSMDGELQDFSIEQYQNNFLITNFPLK